jgi:phosphoglycerate dehydrogenase-like enzyme
VLAVMLAYEKKLPESFVGAPWARGDEASLGGLAGKNLGVVGLGAIGSAIARRALAFDMTVVGLRRTPAAAPPGVTLAASLEALVSEADHLVLAAPATAATAHLVDAAVLRACRPGVHLVNISRGSLVDQDALLAALEAGTVSRATLDVTDPEPLPDGHPLYRHASVRISPHISWSSPASAHLTFTMFVDNLRRYRRGEPLTGVVDRRAGY